MMSIHAYHCCWLHLIWGTKKREKFFNKHQQQKISSHLYTYADEKNIYMKINHVNTDHVHALIDLPPQFSIRKVLKLFKGNSSYWINKNRIIPQKFSWARGYGAFSVSQSMVEKVAAYIRHQKEHHRLVTFAEEYAAFIKAYGLDPHNINR